MTTSVTYRNWNGRPALTQNGEARAILEPGGGWVGADAHDGIDVLTVSRGGANIGEGHFADMFAGWNLPDLDGWYQRRDPNRPYDRYAKVRFWASR
ncbi:hypothetical protein [uncultured Sphingomonas sp.]|uniref:hypothetical protein n=1 Tax=uncultured Sphingomonas sp. TaxID=158754 RepID=UPI0035C95251